tara:strand:+ start:1517 stop:2716 length:1200 start_codon:yes stop_codon:yes gene_type:complete
MTSSYSTDLKLELMVTGENAGTWGDKTNTNLNVIQQAIAGFEQVTLSSGGTLALVMSDGALSNARNMVIKFATASIAASTICTIPNSIEKFYIFDATGLTNPTNLTIKTASGSGFTLDAAKIYAAYSDGTNLNEISLDTLGGTIAAANITGTIATSQIADDAITAAKIADDAVVAAAIADNAVITAGINNDAVTADKLANTAVTAGSYTTASITVDAQGRLTSASSGSAGGGMSEPTRYSTGPTSGTHTASNNSSFLGAFLYAAGGGGAGSRANQGANNGGSGGAGGFGYYSAPISGGATFSFGVGGGGSGGNPSNSPFKPGGSAGGATTFGNFTTNGGNGAPPTMDNTQPGGNAGSAPGAALTYNQRDAFVGGSFGGGGPANTAGSPGVAVVYENSGS